MTKTELIDALDAKLKPMGLKRRKGQQEWIRKDGLTHHWIHINFGKYVINPSIGVKYLDLEKFRPPGNVTTASVMLATLVAPRPSYTADSSINDLVHQIAEVGVPKLRELSNRPLVIEALQADEPSRWPVVSYSHRIRLLPLLLASEGRSPEALNLIRKFSQAEVMDQLLPVYEEFCSWWEEKFGLNKYVEGSR